MASTGKEIVPAPSLVNELSDNSATVSLPETEMESTVENLITTIKRVANGDVTIEYQLLPTHLDDNFEIANLLTDPKYVGETIPQGERLVRYYHGKYHGKSIEFAIEHEDAKKPTPETPILAWGVRKIPDNLAGELPSSRIGLPSGVYMKSVVQIRDVPEVEHPLGLAA